MREAKALLGILLLGILGWAWPCCGGNIRPPTSVFSVVINGKGSISPDYNGRSLKVGSNYTVVAKPAATWLFDNWTNEVGTVICSNPACRFAMQSNLVLYANFVTNRFPAVGGKYNGLFAVEGVERRQSSSGSFSLVVNSAGLFSGKIMIGSQTMPFSSRFDAVGMAWLQIRYSGTITRVSLQMDFTRKEVSGAIIHPAFAAQLRAGRVFSPAGKDSSLAGQYTFVIDGVNDPTTGPRGVSCGTIKIDSVGNVTLYGRLADGAVVSQSSALSSDGLWPFYALYQGGKGSLSGWLLVNNQALSLASELSWINETNANPKALYRRGFTNQNANLAASFFIATNKPVLALSNGAVVLSEGALPCGITNFIKLTTANRAVNMPGQSNKLTLAIDSRTGLISGSCANPLNAGRKSISLIKILIPSISTGRRTRTAALPESKQDS